MHEDKLPVKPCWMMRSQIVAGVLACATMLMSGIAMGWPSQSLPKLMSEGSPVTLTSDEGSWVVSGLQIGACASPLLSAALVDRIGRKWFLLASGIPSLASWVLVHLATSFAHLLVARFVVGLAVGVAFATAPIYVGEIAETRIRGALASTLMSMVQVGQLFSYVLGPFVSAKTLAIASAVPTFLFLVTFVWMPESPYYYLKKNLPSSAERSLVLLRGTQEVSEELREMSSLIECEKKQRGRITELVTVRANRRASMIVWCALTAQQVAGLTPIMAYLNMFLKRTDLELDPSYAVMIIGTVALMSNVLASLLVDRLGRRPLLVLSSFCCCASLLAVAVYFNLDAFGVDLDGVSWLPMLAVVTVNVFFSFGLGPMPYTILAEVYPTTAKAFATMVASIYGSVVGVLVTKAYQLVEDQWGLYVVFYLLAACQLVFLVIIVLVVPETKGKSFKEIQEYLSGE